MSCTSRSRRSCWAGESDYLRGLTCALWDTNAFSSLRRRKPPMLYSGAKGTMTPDNRLQRTAAKSAAPFSYTSARSQCDRDVWKRS